MAKVILEKQGNESAEQDILEGAVRLSPIQQWFFENQWDDNTHFNQAVLLEINKAVSQEQLQTCISALTAQHDALRLSFTYEQEEQVWKQAYQTKSAQLDRIDLSEYNSSVDISNAITAICEGYQKSLDLLSGESFKAVLMETPNEHECNRLFLVAHHLVIDGVSWRILIDQLDNSLNEISKGNKINLGRKTNSIRQWNNSLVPYTASKYITSEKSYWKSLKNKYYELPTDKKASRASLEGDSKTVTVALDETLTNALLYDVNQSYNTRINDILLAALGRTFCSWTQNQQIVVGLEGHGRENISDQLNISETVGWFTSLFPVVLDGGRFSNHGDQIKTIKERLRVNPQNGLSYGLLRYIHPNKTIRKELKDTKWDITFNYLGQLDNLMEHSKWINRANEYTGNAIDKNYPLTEKISINCHIANQKLVLSWKFSGLEYYKSTIQKLADAYLKYLGELIVHCKTSSVTEKTPYDYGLPGSIYHQDLDQFLAQKDAKSGLSRKDTYSRIYPLSATQEGMLYHSLYEDHSEVYIEQLTTDILSQFNLNFFEKAWQQLLNQHDILRSCFIKDQLNIPIQCVHKTLKPDIRQLDYTNFSSEEQQQKINTFLEADRREGFLFEEAPLMRITLIQLSDTNYKMVWTFHHLLLDGWSMPILFEELLSNYQNCIEEKEKKKSDEDRFEDYIHYLHAKNKFSEEVYWKQYLKGFSSPSLLPFTTSKERNNGGGKMRESSICFEQSFSDKLTHFCQKNNLTVNTVIQGVWSFLLSNYTAKEDITYGITVSGRPSELPNIDKRVGLYINTIPLRAKIDKNQNIVDWLTNLQKVQASSSEYQYSALKDIQDWTNQSGDLFDSILVFENYPIKACLEDTSWALKVANVQLKEATNFLLTITAIMEEKLLIQFAYNEDLLSEFYINMIRDHFYHVLQQFVVTDQLFDIKLLTNEQENLVISKFNHTNTNNPKDTTVIDIFKEQVSKTPNLDALVYNEERLTYTDLDRQSDKVATNLVSQGFKAGDFCLLCLDRSPEMIIGILGILKAGGAYIPIDINLPQERISYLQKDTKANFVLTTQTFNALFDDTLQSKTALIEDFLDNEHIEFVCTTNLESLAYVIYTSGSTGKPKGVMITHDNLTQRLSGEIDLLNLDNQVKTCLMTNYAFDVSLLEIFLPLLVGGSIIIPPTPYLKQPKKIVNLWEQEAVTLLQGTPGYFATLLTSLTKKQGKRLKLKHICLGGESLNKQLVNDIRQKLPQAQLNNHYGPTEACIDAIVLENVTSFESNIIGKPIPDTKIYIVNENDVPVPIGVEGEIWIGGPGVAAGYLNRQDLTNEKFIPNPFESNGMVYKSGDIGHWLPSGNIVFSGRKDNQVKIRGNRVEIGEIEQVILSFGQISQCVVTTREDRNGLLQLVGYVVPTKNKRRKINMKTFEVMLKKRLPKYMIPSFWVELETLPLNQNGKVDKKALPEPLAGAAVVHVGPRNDIEQKLVDIWQSLIRIDKIGVHQNFFEIGGHSLLMIRLITKMQLAFGANIPIKTIFQYPTISSMAFYLQMMNIVEFENNSVEFDTIEI